MNLLLRACSTSIAFAAAVSLVGCSDDNGGDPDGPPVAIDAGVDAIDGQDRCPGELYFSGEYSDWDSTTATFDGVEFATWTVRGDASRTATTAPNGRIELCLATGDVSIVDVTATDYLPALFIADPTVFQSPGQPFFLIKGLKAARATTFYQSLGIVFDPNKAHILVQKQGSAIPLELSAASTPFAVDNGDDTTWTSGSTGGLVLFANVDVAAGIGVLSSTSTIVGNTEMPLEAGKLTLATIR